MDDDEKAKADFEFGRLGQFAVADFLRRRGLYVRVPFAEWRPHRDVRFDYSDHGDIFVEMAGGERLLESKRRRFDFVDRWPHDSIILGNVYRLDLLKPFLIFNVSKDLRNACFVDGAGMAHFSQWRIDGQFGANATYVCAPTLATFVALD